MYLLCFHTNSSSDTETGINSYVAVDKATFDSYSQLWLASHEGWTHFDSTSLSCPGQNIFPVCHGNASISDNRHRTCPRAECTKVIYCEHTPPDTIDLIPPPLLTTSDAHMCVEVEDNGEVLAPHYGMNQGIPPLYTPLKVSSLRIKGRLRARFGETCVPIAGATVHYWHADTRQLPTFRSPASPNEQSDLTPTDVRRLSCRGEALTSADGYFDIRSTLPFSYGPPRHINVMVTAEGYSPLTTRIYFSSDVRLQQLVLDRHEEDNFEGLKATVGSTLASRLEQALENGGPTLRDFLGSDPRVINVTFVPHNSSNSSAMTGHFEGTHQLTLRPLRELPDSISVNAAPSGAALNLTGFWADDRGALVRVETQGHVFVAVQYPHMRSWGTAMGTLRGDTVAGVDFRASGESVRVVWLLVVMYWVHTLMVLYESVLFVCTLMCMCSGRAQVSHEQQAALLDTWTQSDTLWTSDLSVGVVLPTDGFSTHRLERSIEWSGGGYDGVWRKVEEPEAYRCVHTLRHTLTHIHGRIQERILGHTQRHGCGVWRCH